MKRAGLYKLVWSKPMTKLGADLGISDVGLAKACRRHAIPVPPRGHRAKLQAGKASAQVPLPQPGTDMEVSFTTVPPARRQAEIAQKREAKAVVAEKAAALRPVNPTPAGSHTPIRCWLWLRYAGEPLAPTCRSRTGSYTAVGDTARTKTGPLRSVGTALHVGRQVGTAEARIVDMDGKLYAHATTNCAIFEVR